MVEEFIRFTCPNCRKSLKAKPEQAGKWVKCPSKDCGQSLKVPQAHRPALQASEPTGTAAPPPRSMGASAITPPSKPHVAAVDAGLQQPQKAEGSSLGRAAKGFFSNPVIRNRLPEGELPVHAEAAPPSKVIAQLTPDDVYEVGEPAVVEDGKIVWMQVVLADGRHGYIRPPESTIHVWEPVRIKHPSCFRFLCPACNWLLRARLAHRGMRGRCPTCSSIIQVPDNAAPVSLGCAFFVLAVPMTLVLLVLGAVVGGLLWGANLAGVLAIAGAVAGLTGGGVLGILNARKNGVVMNDWVTNDPVLSTDHEFFSILRGESGKPVEIVGEASGAEPSEKPAEPPFDFRPGRWGNLGCGVLGLMGIVPGVLLGLYQWQDSAQGPDHNVLTDGVYMSVLVGFVFGFFVAGFFGWGLGLMAGAIADIIRPPRPETAAPQRKEPVS